MRLITGLCLKGSGQLVKVNGFQSNQHQLALVAIKAAAKIMVNPGTNGLHHQRQGFAFDFQKPFGAQQTMGFRLVFQARNKSIMVIDFRNADDG